MIFKCLRGEAPQYHRSWWYSYQAMPVLCVQLRIMIFTFHELRLWFLCFLSLGAIIRGFFAEWTEQCKLDNLRFWFDVLMLIFMLKLYYITLSLEHSLDHRLQIRIRRPICLSSQINSIIYYVSEVYTSALAMDFINTEALYKSFFLNCILPNSLGKLLKLCKEVHVFEGIRWSEELLL